MNAYCFKNNNQLRLVIPKRYFNAFLSIATLWTTIFFAIKSHRLARENIKLQNFNPEIKVYKKENNIIHIAVVNTWLVQWYLIYAGFTVWGKKLKFWPDYSLWDYTGKEIPPKDNICEEINAARLKIMINESFKGDKGIIAFNIITSSYEKKKYELKKKERPELYQ